MTAPTVLDRFEVGSEPGTERTALARVAAAVGGCGLNPQQVDRLKTAVGEAAMNAAEHGNGNRADLPVRIVVLRLADGVAVEITDCGGAAAANAASTSAPLPDLDLKLAGLQTTRGWGLYLIQHMVDAMDVTTDGDRHTVRLTVFTRPADEGTAHEQQV